MAKARKSKTKVHTSLWIKNRLGNFVLVGEVIDCGEPKPLPLPRPTWRKKNRESNSAFANRVIKEWAEYRRSLFGGSFSSARCLRVVKSDKSPSAVMERALRSDNSFTFRVIYPNKDRDEFRAVVMGYRQVPNQVDSLAICEITLEVVGKIKSK